MSAFLSGNIGSGERIARFGQLGFDLKTRGAMFGIDRQTAPAAFIAHRSTGCISIRSGRCGGSLNTTGYAFSVYGSRSGLFAGSASPARHGDALRRRAHRRQHHGRPQRLRRQACRRYLGDASRKREKQEQRDRLCSRRRHGDRAHHGRTDFDLSLAGTVPRQHDDLTESGSGPLICSSGARDRIARDHRWAERAIGVGRTVRNSASQFPGRDDPRIQERGRACHRAVSCTTRAIVLHHSDRATPTRITASSGPACRRSSPHGYSHSVEVNAGRAPFRSAFPEPSVQVRKAF